MWTIEGVITFLLARPIFTVDDQPSEVTNSDNNVASASPRGPRLPPELHDSIIDYLHDDPHTLSACSLTCRSLLPAVRFHRFSHIQLSTKNCIALRPLLTRSPDIGQYVTSLQLMSTRWDSSWESSMAAILPLLPRVATLRLVSNIMTEGTIARLATLAASVRVLELGDINFVPTNAYILDMICAFPCLRALRILGSLYSMSTAPLSPLPARLPIPPATLSELHITHEFPILPLIARWAAAYGVPGRLRTLSLFNTILQADLDYGVAQRLLFAGVGAALERLLVVELWPDANPKSTLPFALTQCTRLRHLEFALIGHLRFEDGGWAWAVPKLLAQIETCSIECIQIELWCSHLVWTDLAWVAELAGPLSRSVFDGLKELKFLLHLEDADGGEALLRGHIPELDARGIVHVSCMS